nr:type VII secretion target [Glycomyces buryatensis]
MIQVEGARLRSSAGKMRGFASDASDIAPDPERECDAADRANAGFMTAEALQAIAKDLKDDMKELNEHWEGTAELLTDIADDWDGVDDDQAKAFDTIGGDLGGFTVPTIAGGA